MFPTNWGQSVDLRSRPRGYICKITTLAPAVLGPLTMLSILDICWGPVYVSGPYID